MTLRRAIFWLHLGSGCLAGAVIFFLALTGSVLTYERQIVAWHERGYRSAPPSPTAMDIPVDQLLSTAASVERKWPSAIILHMDRRDPVEIDFGRTQQLFLNRYTGAVLGAGAVQTRAFFQTVTRLHRWFGASPEERSAARAIQGSFALDLLLMIITGLILWWPPVWTRPRLRVSLFFRLGLKGRARDFNRHLALGAWSSLPLTIITLTGIILGFGWATSLLYRLADNPPPVSFHSVNHLQNRKQPQAHLNAPEAAQLNHAVAAAEQQAVGWHSLKLRLPQASARTLTITVDFGDGTRPDQKAKLVFDRASGRLIHMYTFSSYSRGRRLRLFVHMIHTGEIGGVVGQTISGLASLSCCGIVLTGFFLALRRLQRYSRNKDRTAAINSPPPSLQSRPLENEGWAHTSGLQGQACRGSGHERDHCDDVAERRQEGTR